MEGSCQMLKVSFHGGMRKRGGSGLFSLWMVIMTLFLCGVSISLYNVQQDKLAVSLVSPLPVLELRDNLTIFEMREKSLIRKSLEKTSSEFGSDEFASEFRKNFLSGLTSDMKSFLLRNVVVNKESSDLWDDALKDSFFKNVVYREIRMSGGKLRFTRGKVDKSLSLSSGSWSSVNFPIEFGYEFKREYLISKVGSNFIIEESD